MTLSKSTEFFFTEVTAVTGWSVLRKITHPLNKKSRNLFIKKRKEKNKKKKSVFLERAHCHI